MVYVREGMSPIKRPSALFRVCRDDILVTLGLSLSGFEKLIFFFQSSLTDLNKKKHGRQKMP